MQKYSVADAMNGVLILGAGGHGKVVADILACQHVPVQGYLDDDPKQWGRKYVGYPVLGQISAWASYKPIGIIMGIGDNQVRKKVVDKLSNSKTLPWINAIHPRVILANSIHLGVGIVIAGGGVINPDSTIGDHTIINTGSTVDHDCQLAKYVHVAPGVHVAGGAQLSQGAFIGIGASVTPYQSIGEWSIVGAGAVVINNIPDRATAVGVPAQIQESV